MPRNCRIPALSSPTANACVKTWPAKRPMKRPARQTTRHRAGDRHGTGQRTGARQGAHTARDPRSHERWHAAAPRPAETGGIPRLRQHLRGPGPPACLFLLSGTRPNCGPSAGRAAFSHRAARPRFAFSCPGSGLLRACWPGRATRQNEKEPDARAQHCRPWARIIIGSPWHRLPRRNQQPWLL